MVNLINHGQFLSTPSARRATRHRNEEDVSGAISIHALREEGDNPTATYESIAYNFYPRPPRGGRPCRLVHPFRGVFISIHALREEGDLSYDLSNPNDHVFLSTPSARRATFELVSTSLVEIISIHALREEGDWCTKSSLPCRNYFYPRPPRGGRRKLCLSSGDNRRFLSTPSARRATDVLRGHAVGQQISIHALREEGDRSPHRLPGPRW